MSIIEGAAMRCRTMADGSLRIEIEVEPRNAQAAFALFGAPGRAVALAALKDGAQAVTEKPVSDKPKGGEWAKLAGIWCNSPQFWVWANTVQQDMPVNSPSSAADFMRIECDVNSRAEFDNDSSALARFNSAIRHPFMRWMKDHGVEIDQREHA